MTQYDSRNPDDLTRLRSRTNRVAGALGGIAFLATAAAAHSAELRVTVDGIRSEQGKVIIALHAPRTA